MEESITPKTTAQSTAALPKKEEYPPLPPGQPGNPRQYTPVKVDGRKNPRKKEAFALREKRLLNKNKKKGPRTLPPLSLTRDEYKDVFRTIEDIEDAANAYREKCEKTGDMPTLTGFCLSCGGNSTLLSSYIDGSDKSLARAAQAVADWIIEQMDQAVINGACPVNYAQHIAINMHKRVNSRTYTEGHKTTDINTSGDFTHRVAAPEVIDMINMGPIKPVKQIPALDINN